jgi:hypothetical protein
VLATASLERRPCERETPAAGPWYDPLGLGHPRAALPVHRRSFGWSPWSRHRAASGLAQVLRARRGLLSAFQSRGLTPRFFLLPPYSPNRSPNSSSTLQSFSTCSKAALASTLVLVEAYLRPGVSLRRVPAHLSLPVNSEWRNLCLVLTYMFLTLAGGVRVGVLIRWLIRLLLFRGLFLLWRIVRRR